MKKKKIWLLALFSSIALAISACRGTNPEKPIEASLTEEADTSNSKVSESELTEEKSVEEAISEYQQAEIISSPPNVEFSLSEIEPYTDQVYVAVNDNKPYFSENDLTTQSYEYYSDLDELARCGTAQACIGLDLMPTEDRESISQVKPTGWINAEYDNVDGGYLYNRCHLIGFQLSGENANEKNLITGTRYLNVDGMLPYENMVADYVKETENHVLYRVTPIFEGNNLLASGVLLEAQSVEDHGEDIEFCTYIYNVQPGIVIDYATGESHLEEIRPESESESKPTPQTHAEDLVTESTLQPQKQEPESVSPIQEEVQSESISEPISQGTDYILNINTKKFHYPSCSSVEQMKESNKQIFTGNRDNIISQGYDPCKRCNP